MRRPIPATRAAALGWHLSLAAVRLGFRLAVRAALRRGEPGAAVVGRTLAELFQALGPTYLKLGQLLSTRRDLLPEAAILPLEQLQDRLPPGPFRVVAALFREELEMELADAFLEIDPVPIASASIATVYRGTLRDGRQVAVKVRRPGIARRMREDLRFLRLAGSLLERLPPLRMVPVVATLRDFCAALERQLDFRAEAAANRRLRRALACEPGVVVPELVEELCGPSVLTMELVEGVPLRSLDVAEARAALRAVLLSLYRMIFFEGLIHCDLHRGNLKFLPGGRVALLDFGFMADFRRADRLKFAEFFFAMGTGDGACCARIALEMASSVPPDLDRAAFEADVAALVARVSRVPASEFLVADFVGRLFELQRRHRVRGTSAFVMAIVSLLVVEGLVREVYPELDFQREARPFVVPGVLEARVGRAALAGAVR